MFQPAFLGKLIRVDIKETVQNSHANIILEDLLYFTGRQLFPLFSTSYLMRSGQNYEIIGGRSKKTMKARKAWRWLLPLLRKPIPPSTAVNSLDPSPNKLILLFLPDHVPHTWGRSCFWTQPALLWPFPWPPAAAEAAAPFDGQKPPRSLSEADFAFRPPATSHTHVSAGVSGHMGPPFMEGQLPPGRGVAIAR